MRHTDYLSELNNDTDYQRAAEELRVNFILGDAVIRARTQKGLSQAELAELVGTKQANISRIESALGNPTLKLISKIMNVLDIQVQLVLPTATNSFRSIPVPRIPINNWPVPSQPIATKSSSSESIGNLR
jgi:transcriptional regulator with XRE-family HTH domain